MVRQSISIALLIVYIASVTLSGNDMEYRINEAKMNYILAKDYCTLDEFGEMNYYLYCNSWLREGASGSQNRPSIISNKTKSIDEAKELYQELKEKLPLEEEEENGENDGDWRTEVFYISPDCKWVVTDKWSDFERVNTKKLFYEKKEVKEKVVDIMGQFALIFIVKDGDTYKEVEEQYYQKYMKLKRREEYMLSIIKTNAQGDLAAGIEDEISRLTIRKMEDETEQWSFDLQGIQEEVWEIRDDVQEGDRILVEVRQFDVDEQEGWLVIQVGRSSFFQIAYPSGEVTYLGEYLYSPSFSPDGKYLAYSCVDYDNGVDMYPEEEEQTPPPGIYVKEIETGKTAYIYWYPSRETGEDFMISRSFLWLEKEGFEEYMGDTGGKNGTKGVE